MIFISSEGFLQLLPITILSDLHAPLWVRLSSQHSPLIPWEEFDACATIDNQHEQP